MNISLVGGNVDRFKAVIYKQKHKNKRSQSRVFVALYAFVILCAVSSCGDSVQTVSGANKANALDKLNPPARCQKNQNAGTITFLTSQNFEATPGIIDVIAAQKLGYFEQLCLDVKIRPGTTNAQLLSAGTAQIAGLGNASDAILATDSGANIVAVATYGNVGALTLLTMKNSGINSLQDLAGKTIGYKALIPPMLMAMLKDNGVDLSSINWVSVGFDPAILSSGKVDALAAYRSNEPFTLRKRGHEIVEWDPDTYGVKSTFGVYAANRNWAESNPSAMEDFLRASFYAYSWITSSEENLELALGFASELSLAGFDYDISKQRWVNEVKLITNSQPLGTPVGWQSIEQWSSENEQLHRFNFTEKKINLNTLIDTSYLDAIYEGERLLWPVIQ
jgi:NitT/TauT family transport system substrate-binding protein